MPRAALRREKRPTFWPNLTPNRSLNYQKALGAKALGSDLCGVNSLRVSSCKKVRAASTNGKSVAKDCFAAKASLFLRVRLSAKIVRLMAIVEHRYVRDPQLAAEREAAAKHKEAAAKKREEAAKRRQAAKQAASRASRRGVAGLRREKMMHERVRRLEREMQIARQRGELIEKVVVQRQAAFLLTALRARCMSAPSAWARRLLNIDDPRVMIERLREMMTNVLEEISTLPQKVTAGELNDDVAPAREIDGGNGD